MRSILTQLNRLWTRGRRPRDERGVALLLTMGMMALLLILAMSFAYTARLNSMAMAVNADMVRARLLCKSGLERAMAWLTKTFDNSDPSHVYPATATVPFQMFSNPEAGAGTLGANAAWAGRAFAVSRATGADWDRSDIGDALSTSLGFPYVPSRTDDQIDDPDEMGTSVSWHHIMDGTKLVGRVAFMIVDESGKIDPNAVTTPTEEPYCDDDASETYTAGEHYFDIDGDDAYTGAALTEGTDEVRSGGSPEEMRLGDALDPALTQTDFVDQMPVNAANWFSWRHIFNGGIGGMTAAAAEYTAASVFPYSYDIEAYENAAGDTKHRFDLVPTAWSWDTTALWNDDAEVLSLGGPADDFWDGGNPPAPKAVTAFADGAAGSVAIPWLSKIEASTDLDGDGDVDADDHATLRYRVCANLIDYCDTDSVATTNMSGNPPSAPGGEKPYIGLEKAPYVNEVAICATFIYDKVKIPNPTPPPGQIWDEQSGFFFVFDVELVNIYSDVSTTVEMEAWLTVEVRRGAPPQWHTYSLNASSGIDYPAGFTVAGGSYKAIELPQNGTSYNWSYSGPAMDDPGPPPTKKAKVKVVDVKVVVRDKATGNLVDYVHIEKDSLEGNIRSKKVFYLTCEVTDPRCNDNESCWTWKGWQKTTNIASLDFYDTTPPTPPVGKANPGADPSAGSDSETVGNPAAGMSSAFIRNGPMKTLWEIGAIHRGEPWRTLRISKYNNNGGNMIAAAPYDYASGDANILDQIKVGGYTIVDGKFNANSAYAGAWAAALGGLTVGGTRDNPGAGTVLTAANVTDLTDYILAANGTLGGSAWPSRGGIANVASLSDGTVVAQANDREKEELIGKLVNILTVRPNYFTIIATAQAVKDMSTDVSNVAAASRPGTWSKYYDTDANWATDAATDKWCNILAEQKIMAVVHRDALTNDYNIERIEYLEE